MGTDNFEDKVKGWISKGAKASKKAIETVGDKVQDFTDKSVIKMEIRQLQNKQESKYSEFGKIIFDAMEKVQSTEKTAGNDSYLNLGSEETVRKALTIYDEIQSLIAKIAEKEEEIN